MENVVLTSLSPTAIHLDFFEKRGSPIYQWEVKRDGGVACRTEVGRALKECFDTHARHGVNHYTVVGYWHGGTSIDFHYSTETLSKERKLSMILFHRRRDEHSNLINVLLIFSDRKPDSNS